MNQRVPLLHHLLPITSAAGLLLAAGCGMVDDPAAPSTANDDGDPLLAIVRGGTPDVALAAQSSRDFLLKSRGKMGLDADHDFVVRNAIVDDQGAVHVRYNQTYRGVRVWGGETIVHLGADQRSTDLTNEIKSGINLGTNPSLGVADALGVAHRDLRPMGPYTYPPAAELIIYPHVREQVRADAPTRPGGELNAVDMEQVVTHYSLAYHVQTALENGAAETRHTDYIIDAHSGAILTKWDSLQTAAATGTGNTQYSGVKTINVNTVGASWELRDVVTGMNYATYNLNHATSGQGTIYTDADNTWGDGANYVEGSSTTAANGQTAGVDAHFGVGATAAYYFNVHGRNGIDGAGRATYSRVHYSNSYDNAFWDDSCFCMTYGDGNSFLTLTSIDVAGHEMAHGVTSRTAGLVYSGESGGLNESMSDVNGTMVEFYSRGGSGSTIGNTGGTWTIGEQLSSTPLRYMYKPSKDGASPDAWSSGIGNLDVHYSSGPHNRMFYFLSQGASSTAGSDFYSTYRTCGMTGIGNDHAARIAYKALSAYMTSTTNYAAARTAYLNAAGALYGTSSADYAAVQNAFNAINVGAGATTCGGGGGGGTNLLQNPGFESGAVNWTATAGVIGATNARTGSWAAWLDGYGTTHTDTLSQAVTNTGTSTATQLCFYLHITTAETTTTTAFDKLTVQLNTTTLGTLSNLNSGTYASYAQKCYAVSVAPGASATVKFTGTEDSSLQTSFIIDDTSLQ